VLVPLVVAGRSVSFLVPVLIAHLFGATNLTDAFFYALTIPYVLLVLVGNGISLVAVPEMARLTRAHPDRLPDFVGGAALLSMGMAVALALALWLALPALLPVFTAFDAPTQELASTFLFELTAYLGLAGAVLIFRTACEVQGRFAASALGPPLRGGVTLTMLWLFHDTLGPHVLPAALAMGSLAEVTLDMGILASTGVIPRPSLRLDPALSTAAIAALPVMFGEGLVAINLLADKAFAGLLETGSVSVLEYADRARLIPTTLVESTLLTVAFATCAHLLAAGDRARYAATLDQSFRWLGALLAPPLAGLFIGRHALIALLYGRGAIDEAQVELAARVLGFYVPGLWTMMLGMLAVRAHIVEGKLRPVIVLGGVSAGLNLVLNAAFIGPFGLEGLAAASLVVWITVPALWMWSLRDTLRLGASARGWLQVGAVAAASAALAAIVELSVGAPESVADPVLWAAAVPALVLLGLAIWVTS